MQNSGKSGEAEITSQKPATSQAQFTFWVRCNRTWRLYKPKVKMHRSGQNSMSGIRRATPTFSILVHGALRTALPAELKWLQRRPIKIVPKEQSPHHSDSDLMNPRACVLSQMGTGLSTDAHSPAPLGRPPLCTQLLLRRGAQDPVCPAVQQGPWKTAQCTSCHHLQEI